MWIWKDLLEIVDIDTGELLPKGYNIHKEYMIIDTEIKYITKINGKYETDNKKNNYGIRQTTKKVRHKGQTRLQFGDDDR